jgi:hypothetical protein
MDLNSLGQTKVPAVLARLANRGFVDLVTIKREVFEDDDFGGQTKTTEEESAHCRFESTLSSRLDEGGKWQSYTKHTAMIPYFYGGEAVDLRITDKLVRPATELKSETIFTIKALSKADAYFDLVVEEDVREGQRIDGA